MSNDEITGAIIGAAIEVHRRLGPGLLESVYETCLAFEFGQRGIAFRQQRPMPIRYGDLLIELAYRADFLVEDAILVELKAVSAIHPVHTAQVLTYLELSGLRTALLIDFNVPVLREGIRRFIL